MQHTFSLLRHSCYSAKGATNNLASSNISIEYEKATLYTHNSLLASIELHKRGSCHN